MSGEPSKVESNDPPRIVFNKSFVKRSANSSKDDAAEPKSKEKRLAVNLFEDEIELSDEEGVNLLEIKRKKSANESVGPIKTARSDHKPDCEPEQKPDRLDQRGSKARESDCVASKEASVSVEPGVVERLNEPTNKVENRPLPCKNSEPEKRSESEDDLDELVNEIMKPESSGSHSGSRKKKRKKHKEHKKKKKHKRSRDSD